MRATGLMIAVLVGFSCVCSLAAAQSPIEQDPFGVGGAPTRYRRPSPRAYNNALRNDAVSPYLNLTRRANQRFGQPQYQSMVAPQLERRQAALSQQKSLREMQEQTLQYRQGIAGQSALARQKALDGGATSIRTTGGRSQFMNYMHFFHPGGRR